MATKETHMPDSDWWIPITEDYEYMVDVKALETFKNALLKQGVHLARVEKRCLFRSARLLDMETLKTKGIIGSYTVVKATTMRKVLEEG
jgi:hypothetical protein